MRCRKSTEQESTAVEEKSLATQDGACREYIAAQGWTVADGHVYVDAAASGALFTQEGPARVLHPDRCGQEQGVSLRRDRGHPRGLDRP